MDNNLKFGTSIQIHATQDEVWKAITDPEIVKQYFFGTNLETTWKKGSPIIWQGEWEGKAYVEKGEVLEIDPGNSVTMSYLSATLEDKPENYSMITYALEADDEEFTTLKLIQTGFANQEACDHSEQNWKMVLDGMQKVIESRQEADTTGNPV